MPGPLAENLSEIQAIAIIQARIRSERLYEKSILPLGGIPMLVHIVERAAAINGVSKVIVASGNEKDNRKIADIAANKAEIFFGDDYDVLSRYYLAALPHKPDYVIRITGDNPFTDVALASSALSLTVKNRADLASVADIPVGTAVEIISFNALSEAYTRASTDYQHEHVTPYIKENPDRFKIVRFPAPETLAAPDIRLTVDTTEDYTLAEELYSRLYKGTFFSLEEVLQVLRQHPELLLINKHIVQRPMTHSQQRCDR